MTELQDSLPSGWECKFDGITGRQYFINHNTKTTTWDDPRSRYKSISMTPKRLPNIEQIQLQHGSPDLRRNYVYPSHMSPIQAFQAPSDNIKEFRSSPLTLQKIQDTSLTVDDPISKISAMFPTVSETHIRLLMKKYHNREALVISALQVEKNPITTPGPFATPPPQRNIHHPSVNAFRTPPLGRNSPKGGSPILKPESATNNSPRGGDSYRSSPRPHSSPKLKLRYMKSIFPRADETVILDVLYNNDNNIQKTTEVLTEMGFQRKETIKFVPPKLKPKTETQKVDEEIDKKEEKVAPPKIKTAEEKSALTEKLKNKYQNIAEHLIAIALDSVDFDEKRANQILEIIIQENKEEEETKIEKNNEIKQKMEKSTLPVSQSRQSIKSLLKSEKTERSTFSRNIQNKTEHISANIIDTKGPDPALTQGPNSKLLLEDYVNWQGPNSSLRKGPQNLQSGPNRSLLSKKFEPKGPNPKIRKGPIFGLAKGSIFSQLKIGRSEETRGK